MSDDAADVDPCAMDNSETHFGLRIGSIFIILVTSVIGTVLPIILRQSSFVPRPVFEWVEISFPCSKDVATDRVIQLCQIFWFRCNHSNSVYTFVSTGMGGVDFRVSERRMGRLRESILVFIQKSFPLIVFKTGLDTCHCYGCCLFHLLCWSRRLSSGYKATWATGHQLQWVSFASSRSRL